MEDIVVSKIIRTLGIVLGSSVALWMGATAAGAEGHEEKAESGVSKPKLTEEEKAKKRAARIYEILEKYDTDGDGKLSTEERANKRKNRPNRQSERLEKFDKDGDGRLGPEERKAARKAKKSEREAHQKKMLEQYDEDGDGKLGREERMRSVRENR